MRASISILTIALTLLAGCASAPELVKLPQVAVQSAIPVAEAEAAVVLARFAEPIPAKIEQPESVEIEPEAKLLAALSDESANEEGLTLAMLEQLALANNPTVGQAAAKVRALRGKRCQVGLRPNPTVGYLAGEVGNENTAGQQGGFVGQEFITGGKLEKNRAVVSAEIHKAQQLLAATRQRVRTDIRLSYYRALLAQRRVELAAELADAASSAVEASEQLLAAQEIPQAALLQTEVQHQTALLLERTADNELAAAWRQISAVVGSSDFPAQKLQGDATQLPSELDWEETLSHLTVSSPEIAAAVAELSRARRALRRACVESVPDINTQVSVQFDDGTNDTIASVQVGVPLPLWNRNQGGISQAQSEVSMASQNIDRVELDLKQRLANAFLEYADAKTQVETYTIEILPRAERTFSLVQQGYAAGEVGYLDLLAAQRIYAQTNLAYLDALGSLWKNWTKIDGLLLDDSLSGEARGQR